MSENSAINFEDTATAFASLSDEALKKKHLVFSSIDKTFLVRSGTFMVNLALKMKLPVRKLIRKTLFDQFCGGESIAGSESCMRQLSEYGVKTILDYSVEGEKTEQAFEEAMEEALRVAAYAEPHVSIPFCVLKLTALGSVDLLAKKQSGKLDVVEKVRYEKMLYRIEQVVESVTSKGMRFMLDAEESCIQDEVDEVAFLLMKKFNRKQPLVYNTYQLYRKAALDKMVKDYKRTATQNCFFGAKIVRGAYMEKERARAEEQGYPDPIQLDKAATDRDYNKALEFAVEHLDRFALCAGTHNEQSCQYLVNLMDAHGIDKSNESIYFAQLLGMSDHISFKMAALGYNVAKYVPYGPVEKVLPYLFRRAAENTSIAGQSSREYLLVKKELKRRKQLRKRGK